MSTHEAQIEAVFLAAAECADPAARAAVLNRRCNGDSELRSRVEALLAAHDGPFELPPIECSSAGGLGDRCDYAPGTTIAGRYRLTERIAEGGMGAVWAADQTEPVQRTVAIKLIRPGLETRGLLMRFEAERQALALMEHANIARVFDGGVTASGQPFFVMEYMRGLDLTVYCDRFRLPIRDRVKLLIQVCRAVHHAHQKGIIHRDLKPSNVLVSQDGEEVVLKVIDFGLATATHESARRGIPAAPNNLAIGTPLYMSPEQAANDADIDTRTDVYSLGVMLHELITGRTPPREPHPLAVPAEALSAARQANSTWPGSRLARGQRTPKNAATGDVQSSPLARAARGDLDWIVMKALDQDRSGRYGSASDLARDLERFLNDEPVAARPSSTTYRLSKFARRHRLAIVAGAGVLASLVAGTIVSTLLALRATEAMHLAEAAQANEAVHRQEAEQRRARAEQSFRNASNAIDDYFATLMANKKLNAPALRPLRKELVGEALTYFRRRVEQNRDDPALRHEVALGYFRIAGMVSEIGSREEALAAFQEAVRRYEQVAREQPDSFEAGHGLGWSWQQLGSLQARMGRYADAEDLLQRAVELHRTVGARDPDDTRSRWGLMRAYLTLASAQRSARRYAGAEESLARAFEIEAEQQRGDDPGALAMLLADSFYILGGVQSATGRFSHAVASLERASQLFRQLSEQNPSFVGHRAALARTAYELGRARHMAGQNVAAEACYRQGIESYEALRREDPSNPSFPQVIGCAQFRMGQLQAGAGNPDEAKRWWTAALASFDTADALGYESIRAFLCRADALALLGRWREAAECLDREAGPVNHQWRAPCQAALLCWAGGDHVAHRAACQTLVTHGRQHASGAEATAIVSACLVDSRAVDDWSGVLEIARRIGPADVDDPVSATLVGAVQYRAGQTDNAWQTLEQAIALMPPLESLVRPACDPIRASRLVAHTMLMRICQDRGDLSAADRHRTELQERLEAAKATAPVYCDEDNNWRVGFAVLFAERELARLP